MSLGIHLAIIIPVFNRKETTLLCLKQLQDVDWSGKSTLIIVVDDGSQDGTVAAVREQYPDVCLIEGDGQLWWGGAIDRGVGRALELGCEEIMFLNDDLVVERSFFRALQQVAETRDNALVSSIKLYREAGGSAKVLTGGFRIAGRFRQLHNLGAGQSYEDYRNEFGEVVECDALTGAALLVPAHIFGSVGRLDLENFPHNWSDLEFTLRARRKGCQCVVATNSRVYTEPNPNYHRQYLMTSSRKEYLRNLFDDKKYNYGFSRQWKMATMHKPRLLGIVLYFYKLLGLSRWILLKIVLPRQSLIEYIERRPR